MKSFTAIRNGLKEHVGEGRFKLRDYAVYLYLHQMKVWETGVVWTNAQSIATSFGESKSTVQSCMQKLRRQGYIQYPKGIGKRGNYPVLLINDQPPQGVLTGYSLSGFTDSTYKYVYYEPLNGHHTDVVLSLYSGKADNMLTLCGTCALVVPLLDIRWFRCEDTTSNIEINGVVVKPSEEPSNQNQILKTKKAKV